MHQMFSEGQTLTLTLWLSLCSMVVTCLPVRLLRVCQRVGFRGQDRDKHYAPTPPFTPPSQSLVSSWSLGAMAVVVIECRRDTPSLISSLFQTRTHTLTADTSTLQHKSWFLSAKCALHHEPLLFNSGGGMLVCSQACRLPSGFFCCLCCHLNLKTF